MTTYNAAAVADAVIGFQKPITLQQGRALRDNTLAIAEADTTVPLNLLPTVLLGTITTNAGSSIALTGLVLTPFRFLRCTLSGVSASASGFQIRIQGREVTVAAPAASDTYHGSALIDLFDGAMQATTASYAGVGNVAVTGASLISVTATSQASTTITASTSAGTFDAGYIRVYGLK